MPDNQFADIIELIKQSRAAAIKAVNTELINLYWNVGAYISKRLTEANWGEKTVDELAVFIQENHPELKGFTRTGLYRMVQFYEIYASSVFVAPVVRQMQNTENQDTEIVSAVRTQLENDHKEVSAAGTQLEISDIRNSILAKLSWTHHRIIFSRCKTEEEREFYIRVSIKDNYSSRDMERQIDSGIFERVMIGNQKLSSMLREIHPNIINSFKDSYVFEFLNLPDRMIFYYFECGN